MNILITGGGGFLGQHLARELLLRGLAREDDKGLNALPIPVQELTLLDQFYPENMPSDPRLRVLQGDLTNPAVIESALRPDTQAVFHLAAIVSGQAEADFELGYRINLDGTRLLLEQCHRKAPGVRIVFASSVAVFGPPFLKTIDDTTTPTPQTSYGIQKLIGEHLITDYTRKGYIDGRAVRIPTVSVRPGKANAAASSFASAVIREPLNGQQYVCPVSLKTEMWITSPRQIIANLIKAYELPSQRWGTLRSLNLPGITVSVLEMLESLNKQAGSQVRQRVSVNVDPVIDKIVQTWAAHFTARRAMDMGFGVDKNIDDIIAQHITDQNIRIE